ncbi:MAG TPA: glucosaminidase domain-containing protein [Alphaproteobacteria bacterium]|jgi:Bax protein|nr:glucosaminidase domain-containing protein [Alphaproteobacteria bacterium]
MLAGPAPIPNGSAESAAAATLAAVNSRLMERWHEALRLARFTEGTLPPVTAPLVLASASEVTAQYAARNVRLDDVRNGDADVPAVFLARFPEDLGEVKSAKQRKRVFLQTMLPLVLRANAEIRLNRRRLLQISAREKGGIGVTEADSAFRLTMAKRYGVQPGEWEALLRRVDIVPPSLALAQGAEESGWGTSRFARHGNAVFGQRSYGDSAGLVPQARGEDAGFQVAAFDYLYTSVRAYMRNLNTHPAYAGFRAARATMRQAKRPLDSDVLVTALHRYSERGEAYVRTIRTILRANKLNQFDDVRLAAPSETAERENRIADAAS